MYWDLFITLFESSQFVNIQLRDGDSNNKYFLERFPSKKVLIVMILMTLEKHSKKLKK